MAYNIKYTLSFKDTFDDTIKLDILQRDYSGAAITVKGSADPVILKLDSGSDDIFENIKPTSCELNFFVESAGTFDEFYEIDSKEYQVKIYKNSVCIWSGWINDEVFQEEYSPGYYEISLTATDGIAFLKTKRTALTSRQTHFDIIKEALDEIGLAINIVDAVNIFEDSHNTADGPLKQTSFDTDVFADGSEKFYLSDTLKDVLFTYGARITQHENKWVIATIESFYAGLSGIEYTSAGVKVGAYTYSTQKTISITANATNICLLQGGTIQKNKGWRELKVKQVLGKTNKAIILNGDFSSTTEYPGDKEKRTISNWFADAAQTQKWNYYPGSEEANVVELRSHPESGGDYLFCYDLLSMGSDPVTIYSDLINTVEIEADVSKVYVFTLKYALLQIWGGTTITNKYKFAFKVEAINEGGTTYYLNYETQSWQTEATQIELEDIPYQNKDEFSFHDFTCKTVGFPGGKIRVTLYCYSRALDVVYYGTAVYDIKFFTEEVNNDIGYVYQSGVNDVNFTHVPEPIEFTENDIPIEDPSNIPIFYKNYLSLANGEPTLSWTSGEGYTGYLSSIYLQSILNQHSKSTRVKQFNAIGVVNPNMVLKDEQDVLFMITGYSCSLKDNQIDINCFEIIEPNTATITVTTVEYLDDPESSGGTNENGGGTGTGTVKDRLVSMVNNLGVETGPPGRLQDKLFHLEYFGNNPTYVPRGIGFGLREAFNDYNEVLAGNWPVVGSGTADSWVSTDRLFSIGNGTDNDNRSNALTIWKSGYAGFFNAICISAYNHEAVTPIDGSLQYTALNRFEGYFNEKWNKLAYSTDIIDTFIGLTDTPATYGTVGTFPYMATENYLGWSAYTLPVSLPSVDSVPVITSAGTSSWMDTSLFKDAWLKGGQNIGAKKVLGSIDNFDVGFITNNTERITIDKGGLVTFTGNSLKLQGTTNSSPYGVIYKGSTPFIHDFNYGNNGSVTTAGGNTFVGENAGNLTMGSTATQTYHSSYNTFSGYQSGYSNTTGSQNTFSGFYTGYSNTTGYANTFSGYQAGRSNTTGYSNTFNGYAAGYSNTTGRQNTFSGYQSGYSNTTGYSNTFSGYQAGYSNTTGYANTFSGYQAGFSNTTGYSNTFSGYQAGYSNTTGYSNAFSGVYAGYSNTTGYTNTFSGTLSGYSNTTGYSNTFSGYQAGFSNTTGSYNTFSGYLAGRYIANGTTALTVVNQSIFIGANTKAKQDNSTNEIVIGYNTIGNGSNTVTIGNTSITDNFLTGNLQIGNKFKILEGGSTPTKYTIFQGGDQTADITYTLPTSVAGGNGYVLSSTTAGVLSWVKAAEDIWYLNGGAACYDNSVYIGNSVNRNGLLTVLADVGTFNVSSDGIFYTRTGSSSDTIFILNSVSGGTNPGYMAAWVAYNDTKYLKCVNGTSGYTQFEINADGQIYSAGNLYPSTKGTAGQFLQTNGVGGLSWQTITGSQWTTDPSIGISYANNIGIGDISHRSAKVYATTTESYVHALYGFSQSYTGIAGVSTSSYGITGTSSSGVGVYGTSAFMAMQADLTGTSGFGIEIDAVSLDSSTSSMLNLKGKTSPSNGYNFINCSDEAGSQKFRVNSAGTVISSAMSYFTGGITFKGSSSPNFKIDGTGAAVLYNLQIGGNTCIDSNRNGYFNTLFILTNQIFDSGGFFRPVGSTDTDAPGNSVYYSSTQSKLCYKDNTGTVKPLY